MPFYRFTETETRRQSHQLDVLLTTGSFHTLLSIPHLRRYLTRKHKERKELSKFFYIDELTSARFHPILPPEDARRTLEKPGSYYRYAWDARFTHIYDGSICHVHFDKLIVMLELNGLGVVPCLSL